MSGNREVELVGDPKVDRWPAHPDLFVVSYKLEGPRPARRQFAESVKRDALALGIQEVTVHPDEVILYGVRQGLEAAVHRVVAEAIRAENQRRRRADEESERTRPDREAAAAQREAELNAVREEFRRARETEK